MTSENKSNGKIISFCEFADFAILRMKGLTGFKQSESVFCFRWLVLNRLIKLYVISEPLRNKMSYEEAVISAITGECYK